MIFDCGENFNAKVARLEEWHPFFPLIPRTVAVENGRDVCVWLEWIERKGKYFSCYAGSLWVWEYRRKT